MLKIRPHHILCMKAYIGKGYSEEFNKNMKEIVDNLNNDTQNINVILGIDSICNKCPHNLDEKECKSEEKVNRMDMKVCDYFDIKEGIYKFSHLKENVYSKITEEMFDDICGDCEWHKITNCKELIVK